MNVDPRVDVALESAEEEVPRAVDPVLSDSSSECSVPASASDAADGCSARPAASPVAAAAVSDSAPRSAALPPRLRLGSGTDDALLGAPSSVSPLAKRARGASAHASAPSNLPREIRLADGGVAYESVNPVTGRVLRTS